MSIWMVKWRSGERQVDDLKRELREEFWCDEFSSEAGQGQALNRTTHTGDPCEEQNN